ncbi:MAG: hypothetical protein WBC44_11420 [Planctomycetaceae bacterium]
MGILADFADGFGSGERLIVMPLSRLQVEQPHKIDGCVLYPPNGFDVGELRPVPNATLNRDCAVDHLEGQRLREVQTTLTGFGPEVFAHNPAIAFRFGLEWNEFLDADHRFDRLLLQRLNRHVEPILDMIRFDFCRFDLPDTLPGRAGSWVGSGPHWGAILFAPEDHESYLIAGPVVTVSIVQGLGVELDRAPRLPPGNGEIGSIARHVLALFRDVLEAGSDTHRFIRAMTLMEFLAAPDSYSGMTEATKEIACHVASNPQEYAQILERFKNLTDKSGLRTSIVHRGQYLEDIIPAEAERRLLFRELQGYASAVITDMLDRPQDTWKDFLSFRRERRREIGVSPRHETA